MAAMVVPVFSTLPGRTPLFSKISFLGEDQRSFSIRLAARKDQRNQTVDSCRRRNLLWTVQKRWSMTFFILWCSNESIWKSRKEEILERTTISTDLTFRRANEMQKWNHRLFISFLCRSTRDKNNESPLVLISRQTKLNVSCAELDRHLSEGDQCFSR